MRRKWNKGRKGKFPPLLAVHPMAFLAFASRSTPRSSLRFGDHEFSAALWLALPGSAGPRAADPSREVEVVAVLGDYDGAGRNRLVPDGGIVGPRTEHSRCVFSLVAAFNKPQGKGGWKVGVHQKAHDDQAVTIG